MYEIVKNVILSKQFELSTMLRNIDKLWIEQKLSDEQRNELIQLTQSNADPSQSNAPLQKQIEELSKQQIAMNETIQTIQSEIKNIKDTISQGGTVVPEPEPPIIDEYPEWEPYNGIPPVPYQVGSKVTHYGKKYESMVPNNVWEPGVFGVGNDIWKEVM